MKLTTYTNASDFLAHAQAALATDEVANNLMLGIALRLKAAPDTAQAPPYLATVAEGDELIFATLMTPPFPLTVFSPDNNALGVDEAFRLIGNDLQTNGWPVTAISGCVPLSERCAAIWCSQTGGRYRLLTHERIYELRQVIPLQSPPPGRLSVATAAQADIVAQWAYEFSVEALPHQTPQYAGDSARRHLSLGDIFVWEDGGSPVSMAGRGRRLATAVSIGMVYTPPALRGRGYASACVAALSQHLLDQGWQRCTLFTDMANPTSNRIYQKIGYVPVGDYDEVGLILP
jgi:uncharacterized protein